MMGYVAHQSAVVRSSFIELFICFALLLKAIILLGLATLQARDVSITRAKIGAGHWMQLFFFLFKAALHSVQKSALLACSFHSSTNSNVTHTPTPTPSV